jgi:hypothetical protein
MNKNKHYFLRLAILKTMATGMFYLFVPLIAKMYHSYIGWDYIGYTALGSGIMILGNIVLLVRAWALAFDSQIRKDYFKEN